MVLNPKGPVGDLQVVVDEVIIYSMDEDGFIGYDTAEKFLKKLKKRIDGNKTKTLEPMRANKP